MDLTRQAEVEAFFRGNDISQVYLAAAKVGGIHANNTYPAQFIYENLMIECNVIHSAHQAGVQNLPTDAMKYVDGSLIDKVLKS